MLPPRLLILPAFVLLLAGGGLLAWKRETRPPEPVPSSGVVPPSNRWRLAPEAALIEDGTRMPARLSSETSGGTVRLVLVSGGRAVDRESYALSEGTVALAEGADESYSPPIPLVTRAGGSWGWKGTMDGHGAPVPAEAKVVSRPVSFALNGASFPAVESIVTLIFGEDAASGAGTGRTLRTVYVPGRGVVHREFGSSIRTVEKGGR